ncbi:MAG: antibiotic biosynthesis monooxygenase [Desulfobacteraceae bacterium IS3]|jgi:heme-degrading monooxygenase HmoA|nr:MAG: antibiotic biosynthesis monooxygenase [Desulfobacteraceae bacterium IS3]HAO20941.1 antibiotic biosynthesis monooxygenase [Desulfobacteraceae bacterium]
MAVKVLIKRKVPQNLESKLLELLRQLRTHTMNQPGYISGETLKRLDKPEETLVISTWQSVEDWRKWVMSSERKEIQSEIDVFLGTGTEYELYEY